MRVTITARQDGWRMYQIVDGNKWWTARHRYVGDDWYVVNSRGTELVPFGRTWMQVVAACEAFAAEYVDA